MGYDIYIGNTEMEKVEQYEDEEPTITPYSRVIKGKTVYFRPVVRDTIKLPDAPVFPNDDSTGNSNYRGPSYTTWHNFIKCTGLEDVFFHKQHGLMRKHPGHATLESRHLDAIQQAVASFKRQYPYAIPRFGEEALREDAHFARLLWLEWWVRWALEHCEHSGIYNF